ncbi:uncharacterized protein LOC133814388 [Humulus lupulus]|uniref:uncharacterized protein LOC133814388 n=1 Tax=Humulus lupulus TaxID=3486 RepID=UPI002B41007C|nr:uncharacterized protein LOC133814388 [Humulus lupulus]
MVNLKSMFSFGDLEAAVKNNKLNLRLLYTKLLNKERLHFANVVWCKLALPKHIFMLWQAILGHLLTRDNLVHCHIKLDSLLCPVCELEQETHDHLFFECIFSHQVGLKVASWLGDDIWPTKFEDWSNWMVGRPKGLKKNLAAAALAATVYILKDQNLQGLEALLLFLLYDALDLNSEHTYHPYESRDGSY